MATPNIRSLPRRICPSYRSLTGFGPGPPQTEVVLRTPGSPAALVPSIRTAVEKLNSENVIFETKPMEDIVAESLAARRFSMILLSVFAALALLLSSIGIYGVISYVVGQRTHEIGIRMALGAQRGDVLRLMLGEGMRMALIGVAIGATVALGLTHIMVQDAVSRQRHRSGDVRLRGDRSQRGGTRRLLHPGAPRHARGSDSGTSLRINRSLRMGNLLQDIRFGLRTLGKNPGFAIVAVLTLALGIGANAAIFSLTDQVLLRLLPVERPQELVVLHSPGKAHGRTWNDIEGGQSFSYPMYKDLRDRNEVFSGLLARYHVQVSVAGQGQSQLAEGELVSGNYFEVLGVRPCAGASAKRTGRNRAGRKSRHSAQLRLLGAPFRQRPKHFE